MRLYPGVSIITLGVADVARASAFYARLGWRRSVSASNEHISFFLLNTVVLALFNRDALAEDAGFGAAYWSVAGGDDRAAGALQRFSGVTLAQNYASQAAVRQAMDEAMAAGARELVRPSETFWGGYHAVFADPDNHVWELAHNPFVEVAPDGSVTMPD